MYKKVSWRIIKSKVKESQTFGGTVKMDLNQMTTKTQEAIMSAQSLAVSHHHQEVDTVHLLFTLLEEQDGLAVRIFQKMNVDIEALKEGAENLIKKKAFRNGERCRSR